MLREIKIDQLSKLKKGDVFMTKGDTQLVSPMYYKFIQISGESVEVYSLDSDLKINSAKFWIAISAFNTRIKYGELFILRGNENE